MKAGSVFVDHTTTSSDIAIELSEIAKEYNIHFLDAPVSGGEVGAVKGELTVMIGGEKPIFDRVNSIRYVLSKIIISMLSIAFDDFHLIIVIISSLYVFNIFILKII